VLIYVFVGGAIVALIILRVKEDVVVGSSIIASVAVIIVLRLIISVGVAIIVIIVIRRLLRVYTLTSLFSLTKGVFTSFTL
jgi:hypothetical protein